MIRQVFQVETYWEVIVFWNIDYNLFDIVEKELEKYHASLKNIRKVYKDLRYGKAKAATYSSIYDHVSIVLFNRHKTNRDYINSIVHEAEHVKQDMLYTYYVEDRGEPPAYTVGYLVMKMYEVFRCLLA